MKKTQEEQMEEICDSLITDDEVGKLLICLIKGRGSGEVSEQECADFIAHIAMARFVTHSADLHYTEKCYSIGTVKE